MSRSAGKGLDVDAENLRTECEGTSEVAPSVEPHSLATDLSQAVTRFRRAMQRSARANFDAEALSPTEVELLLLVAERPGIGVAVAASELGAAPNTVSTLIRKLVTLGLLRRRVQPRRPARGAFAPHRGGHEPP